MIHQSITLNLVEGEARGRGGASSAPLRLRGCWPGRVVEGSIFVRASVPRREEVACV